MMPNDAKRCSHSAPGNGHQLKRRQMSWTLVPNRQQKTGDKYPARPGEWEKAIVVAADIGYLVPDLQK
jgi:hypothetical protein